jgi:hypothetical protein
MAGKGQDRRVGLQRDGFLCNKESDGRGRSGSAGCTYSKGPPLANIQLMMTGTYSVAQLKRLFFIN